MNEATDKVRPSGKWARPAIFEGKKLVRVSTCPWHPKYQAKRSPRGACICCAAIWRYVESLVSDEPVVML